MAEFDPSIADAVLAACRAGAGEASGALGRTLDTTLELAVGEATTYDAAALADELNGPGLAILQIVGKLGAVALLSEATGLLPAWYGQPDATGTSKLATMAQELGMLLLPEEFMPDDFRAARVPHLAQALERGGFANGTALVKLPISAGENQATLYLLWPGSAPGELFNAPPEAAPAAAPPVEAKVAPVASVEKPAPVEVPKPVGAPPAFAAEDRLNPYTRSLLRIPVPVIVTLAKKKQPLKKIVDLRPGSIIQFDKSCEEMLELEVNNQVVAEGECVKAGDKFGLRVTSIRPPDERFKTVRR